MTHPKAFPPSELIRDEIDARGWTALYLSESLGWPVATTIDLLNGRVRVTAAVAERLGRAFGTSGALWLNLQKHYDQENHEDNQ